MWDGIVEIILVFVPAIISGGVAVWVSKNEIRKVEEQNANDLKKLMEQHKIDISSLREQHALEMEKLQQEHTNKLEILKNTHENEIVRKQKELENSAIYSSMGNAMNGLLGNVLGMAMNSEVVREKVETELNKAFEK